jgi:hypothetical protein
MKKFIALPLILAIAACGDSSDDKDNNAPSLDIDLPVIGEQNAPDITDGGDITSQESVELNKSYSSDIDGSTVNTFSFDSLADQNVLIKIESTTGDIDLYISDSDNKQWMSSGDTSNEAIVFQAEKGMYTIDVESTDDQAGLVDFKLTVVAANTASAGLTAGEILATRTVNFNATCTPTDGGTDESYGNASVTNNIIINFSEGYLFDTSDKERLNFTTTSGNSFTVTENTNEDGEISKGSMTITLDPTAKTITGTFDVESTDSDETCIIKGQITGEVLLSK